MAGRRRFGVRPRDWYHCFSAFEGVNFRLEFLRLEKALPHRFLRTPRHSYHFYHHRVTAKTSSGLQQARPMNDLAHPGVYQSSCCASLNGHSGFSFWG